MIDRVENDYPDTSALRGAYDVLDEVIGCLAVQALHRIDALQAGKVLHPHALQGAVAPQARYLLGSIMRVLVEDGELVPQTGDQSVVIRGGLSSTHCEPIDFANNEIFSDPFFRMLEHWWQGFEDFVRGRRRGMEVLFPRGDLSDWAALHSQSVFMRHYARIAASLAIDRVEAGDRVLEIGGGTGAAFRHFRNRGSLAGLAQYCFSDVSKFFFEGLDGAGAKPVVCRTFDFDRAPGEQGFAAEYYDLILGANALHVADDICKAVARVTSLLKPGGWLVLGEGAPGQSGRLWRPDLLFAMLPGWWDVHLDPALRPRKGFLSLDEWDRVLRLYGLVVNREAAASSFRAEWFGGGFVAQKVECHVQ